MGAQAEREALSVQIILRRTANGSRLLRMKLSPLSSVLRLSLPAWLLAAVVLVPFLQKAFTIDDTLFLLQAEQLLRDPWHPTAFSVVWRDVPQRMSAIMPSGPVMAYALLPSVWLAGSEVAAHLVQLLALWLAVAATVSLGLTLGLSRREVRWAGVCLACTPAVLGMAATAMPDVAAMALGVLFVERYAAWRQQQRTVQLVGAAVCLALGFLARSHLVLLGGVVVILACPELSFWSPRRFLHQLVTSGRLGLLAPLGLGLGLSASCLHVLRDPEPSGTGIFSAAEQLARLAAFPLNLVAFLSHWGLCLPLCLPWAVLRFSALRLRALWILVPLMCVIIVLTSSAQLFWVGGVVALSAVCLYDIVADAVKRRDHTQFVLAVWLFLALPVGIYIHLPSKYLIASAPAMALLLARRPELGLQRPDSQRAHVLGYVIPALCAVMGVLIISADARFGSIGRQAAAELIAPRVKRGEKVWFVGHWGFQYYAAKAGARCLTRTFPYPQKGDVIVVSTRSVPQAMELPPSTQLQLIETRSDAQRGGRIMSLQHGAGFFSNGWGYLPWTFGWDEIDRIEVWQVK